MAAAALKLRRRLAGRWLPGAAALALLAGAGFARAAPAPSAGGEPKVWRALSDENRPPLPRTERAAPAPRPSGERARAASESLAAKLLIGALLAVVAVAVVSFLAGQRARRREALSRTRQEAAVALEDADRIEGVWRSHLRPRRR